MQHITASQILRPLFFLLIGVFIILRFNQLDADFPIGITKSGALYTDEGWYTAAAIREYFFGEWYVADDFNAATNVPTAQALFYASFSLLEPGFASGRLVTALFSLLLIFLLTHLIRKNFGETAFYISLALLTSNFIFFAYSRLMLLEVIGTCFGLLGLTGLMGRPGGAKVVLASAFLSVAILTKTTMIVFIPVVMSLLFFTQSNKRQALIQIAVCCGILTLLVGGFYAWSGYYYPEDFAYFKSLNLNNRSFDGPIAWALNLPYVAIGLRHFGYGLIVLTFLSLGYCLYRFESFRKNPFIWSMLLFLIAYMGLLSLVSYNPPRYYLPLIIPIVVLIAVALSYLVREKGLMRQVSLFALGFVLLFQGYKVISYSLSPTYSLKEMAHGVRSAIQSNEQQEDVSDVLVLGNIVDTIAIETGIRTMNSSLSTMKLAQRLPKEKPAYYVGHANSTVAKELKAQRAELRQLGKWQVFGLGDSGMAFELFQIQWPDTTP